MKTPAVISRLAWFTQLIGTPTIKPTPRIGLCLSSGGARGLAHVGVIQVLEEEKIPIAAIAGTSMGAYVGSLWAAGLNGSHLEKLAREIKDRKTLLRLLDPVFPPFTGLIRGDKMRKHLERSLSNLRFEDLPKPMIVVATDLDQMKPVIFDRGNIARAVQASAAIPGIFTPVEFEGHRYTDGGASEPLPVTSLREHFTLDHVIAVNVMPETTDLTGRTALEPASLWNPFNWFNLMAPGHVLDTFRRSLLAAQIQIASREAEKAEVVVHPFLKEGRWYDFENFDRYIQAGRTAAHAALPQIRALIDRKTTTPTGGYYETAPSHTALGLVHA